MKPDLLVWTHAEYPGACYLKEMLGFDYDNKLVNGTSLEAAWPENVRFLMDPDSPTDNVTLDSIAGLRRIIIASERLTDFLRKRHVACVEYLPVTVMNHKRRAIKERYFLVNLLEPQDCLVIDQCGAEWSSVAKTNIRNIKRLVIDPSRIDSGRELF